MEPVTKTKDQTDTETVKKRIKGSTEGICCKWSGWYIGEPRIVLDGWDTSDKTPCMVEDPDK